MHVLSQCLPQDSLGPRRNRRQCGVPATDPRGDRLPKMPWAGRAAYRDRRTGRRDGGRDPRGNCESAAFECRPGTRGLHAMPSGDHYVHSAACHPAAGPRTFFLPAGRAPGRFPADIRPRGRNGRPVRDCVRSLPDAQVAVFPQERREVPMYYLPRSAQHSARRNGHASLQRHLPRLPRGAGTNGRAGSAHGRRKLRGLPYAEAPDRRRGARGDDGPLDPEARAGRRSAGG